MLRRVEHEKSFLTSGPHMLDCCMIVSVVAVNCGAILTNQSGWFSPPDPDEDGLYQFKSDCVWVIRARDYKALQIQFTEIDIEEGLMCRYDYVRVRTESDFFL